MPDEILMCWGKESILTVRVVDYQWAPVIRNIILWTDYQLTMLILFKLVKQLTASECLMRKPWDSQLYLVGLN